MSDCQCALDFHVSVEPPPEKVKPSAPEGKENKASRASQSSGLKKVSEQMGVKTLKSFKPVLGTELNSAQQILTRVPSLHNYSQSCSVCQFQDSAAPWVSCPRCPACAWFTPSCGT